ncbi:MAG: hypothetical protein JHC93_05560 [Parachlamydiales bacterium]|nr:hypothetical protein [Parachlamydiales bacterium]
MSIPSNKSNDLQHILSLIKSGDINAFFSTPLGNIKRLDLDSLDDQGLDDRMCYIAKFITSLWELYALEKEKIGWPKLSMPAETQDQILNVEGIMNSKEAMQRKFMGLAFISSDYRHLLMVPNGHAAQEYNKEIYAKAIDDSLYLPKDDLEKIYTAAWSNVKIRSDYLATITMKDLSFDDYAFNSICNGLLKNKDTIVELAFPFSLTKSNVQKLIETLDGKKLQGQFNFTIRLGVPVDIIDQLEQVVVKGGAQFLRHESKI